MTETPIYLDHQATTPCAPSVVEAMAPYWSVEFGNPHSSNHAFGWRADDAVTAARESVADLIGATAEEVVFTSGATEANNLAILGLLQHMPGAGRNVVVSAIEHKCVLESARQLQRAGYTVRLAPVRPSGHVDLDTIASLIDSATDLVSVMLVNNEIGTIQPIAEIAALCRSGGSGLPLRRRAGADRNFYRRRGARGRSDELIEPQDVWAKRNRRLVRLALDPSSAASNHSWRWSGERIAFGHRTDAAVRGLRRSGAAAQGAHCRVTSRRCPLRGRRF